MTTNFMIVSHLFMSTRTMLASPISRPRKSFSVTALLSSTTALLPSTTALLPRAATLRFSALACLATMALACKSAPPEPEPKTKSDSAPQAEATTVTAAVAKPVAAQVPVSSDDPLKGQFTLEDATKGLEGKGKLNATIDTSLGSVSCELYDDKAPITVANFVGLARGVRPFKDKDEWVKRPGYDGTIFHRVIKGFMIQGGDPEGKGSGEPGYVIPDEIWEGAKHDRRGLLCMANRGKNTNGMQFFITDANAPHLDGGYTIFGECGPDNVIEKLASVDTGRTTRQPGGDRPLDPPVIKSIVISRAP